MLRLAVSSFSNPSISKLSWNRSALVNLQQMKKFSEQSSEESAKPKTKGKGKKKFIPEVYSNDKTLVGRRLTGTTKWYDGRKGIGAIKLTETESVFVYQTNIKKDGWRSLEVNEQVEYDVAYDEKKDILMALNITGPNGAPVIGKNYQGTRAPGSSPTTVPTESAKASGSSPTTVTAESANK